METGSCAMFPWSASPRWGVRLQLRQFVSTEKSCFCFQLLLSRPILITELCHRFPPYFKHSLISTPFPSQANVWEKVFIQTSFVYCPIHPIVSPPQCTFLLYAWRMSQPFPPFLIFWKMKYYWTVAEICMPNILIQYLDFSRPLTLWLFIYIQIPSQRNFPAWWSLFPKQLHMSRDTVRGSHIMQLICWDGILGKLE